MIEDAVLENKENLPVLVSMYNSTEIKYHLLLETASLFLFLRSLFFISLTFLDMFSEQDDSTYLWHIPSFKMKKNKNKYSSYFLKFKSKYL